MGLVLAQGESIRLVLRLGRHTKEENLYFESGGTKEDRTNVWFDYAIVQNFGDEVNFQNFNRILSTLTHERGEGVVITIWGFEVFSKTSRLLRQQ